MKLPRFRVFDARLRVQWRRYVLQSLCAVLCIFAIIMVFHLDRGVTITSLAATTFIVFAMPKSITARPRNILGSHFLGMTSGLLLSFVPHPGSVLPALVYALAIGATMFLMVATNTEHPPAAGTALAVVMAGWQPRLLFSIIISVVLLALVRRVFGSRLLNLV